MTVTHISNKEELTTLLSKNDKVMIDFFAEWCGPCKRIAPEIEKASEAKDWKGVVAFVKVDVDAVEELAKEYDIEAMPTFIFLQKGKEVTKLRVKGADLKAINANLASLKAEK